MDLRLMVCSTIRFVIGAGVLFEVDGVFEGVWEGGALVSPENVPPMVSLSEIMSLVAIIGGKRGE
jgi:hypothetical protein